MSNEIDLLYTDVEEALRASVRSMLGKRCTPARVTAMYDGDRGVVAELWRGLTADLGLAGLLVPEEFGGAGASAREAAVVLEELGRTVAPVPFLTSAVVATTALNATGCLQLWPSIASGDLVACLAVPCSTIASTVAPTVSANAGILHGTVSSVAGALEARLLLVPVAGQDGLELHAVDAEAVRIRPVVSLDMTRQLADIDFSGAATRRLADAERAADAIRHALINGAGLMASEQLGLAQWCLESTVEYLGMRRQFGRIVGSFQALKHRLADLYVAIESACAAARYAAAAIAADDPDQQVAASLAQAYCAEVAVLAAEECIQLHGGIGMTWEHPAHLYLKRAKADQIAFGAPGTHHMLLAEHVDLPPATAYIPS